MEYMFEKEMFGHPISWEKFVLNNKDTQIILNPTA